MVSAAISAISSEAIKKSFRVCGIAPDGEAVPHEDLNSQLQLWLAEGTGDHHVVELVELDDDEGSDSGAYVSCVCNPNVCTVFSVL